MVKLVDPKTFIAPVVGGRRHTRPFDTSPPTAPSWPPNGLSPPVPTTNSATILWVNGQDGDSGIRDTQIEISPAGLGTWVIQPLVSYDLGAGVTATLSGLSSSTAYDVRVANHNFAGTLGPYSPIITFSTLGSTADLVPGTISLVDSTVTLQSGQSFSLAVERTGAGVSGPIVEADYSFSGTSLPSPGNNTLSWPAATNSIQLIQGIAPTVSVSTTISLNLVAVRALSGNIAPGLGLSQANVVVNPLATGTLKDHPGFYAASRNPTYPDDRKRSQQLTEINAVLAAPHVLGLKMYYLMGCFGDSPFDFSKIFRDLNILRAAGKRLKISIQGQIFGVATDYTSVLPPSVYNNSNYGASPVAGKYGWVSIPGSVETTIAYWRSYEMTNYIIPLFQAMAAAVNPTTGLTLDQDPFVERTSFIELALGPTSPVDPLLTSTSRVDQYINLIDAINASWITTPHMCNNNFAGSTSESQRLTDYCGSNRTIVGGPDTFITGQAAMPWGTCAVLGVASGNPSFTGPDKRGIIALECDTQGPEISAPGRYKMYTPHSFYSVVNNLLQQTHMTITMVDVGITAPPIPAYPTDGLNTGQHPGNWNSFIEVINGSPLTHTTLAANLRTSGPLVDGGDALINGSGFGTNVPTTDQAWLNAINGPIEAAAVNTNARILSLPTGWSWPGADPQPIGILHTFGGSKSILARQGYSTETGGVYNSSIFQFGAMFDFGAGFNSAYIRTPLYVHAGTPAAQVGQEKILRIVGPDGGGLTDSDYPNILINNFPAANGGNQSALQIQSNGGSLLPNLFPNGPFIAYDDYCILEICFFSGTSGGGNGTVKYKATRYSDGVVLASGTVGPRTFWSGSDSLFSRVVWQRFVGNQMSIDGSYTYISRDIFAIANKSGSTLPKWIFRGDQPTFAACDKRKLVVQKFVTWTDGSIRIKVNLGVQSSLNNFYCYIMTDIDTPLNPNGILAQAA